MKFLSSTLVGAVIFCQTSFAEQNNIKKQTIEACASWVYNFEMNAYLCRRTLPSITVYAAAEVDKQFDRLEKMIHSLETRVKALEEK